MNDASRRFQASTMFSVAELKRSPNREEIYSFIMDAVDILTVVIREQKQRIDALEAREDAFKGVHQRAQSYRKGDLVTCGASLWVALKQVPEGTLPGNAPEFWQLAAKGK
jgi:U3 small nucleolar RNA-associated protein 14